MDNQSSQKKPTPGPLEQGANLAQNLPAMLRGGRLFVTAARGVGALVAMGGWPVLVAIALVLGFTLFFVLFGRGGGEGLPVRGASRFLDYTIRIRDTSILPLDRDGASSAILKEFPKAQLRYWDTIVSQSITNGWNPAFVLALWIEETGASHYTKTENGGGGGAPLANGHLGCAPWEDQDIDESLGCLFKNFSEYADVQFESFMRRYSAENVTGPFLNNPQFPERIKKYYSLLVPSGPGALTIIESALFVPVVPPPPDEHPARLRAKIVEEFNVNMDPTFNYDYLKWTWEKLWNIRKTRFFRLLTGEEERKIFVREHNEKDHYNHQVDCSTIHIRGFSNKDGRPYPEHLFKVVLIHELTHIVENCVPDSLSRKSILKQTLDSKQEDYLTNYSKNNCAGATPLSEDYAEMISYFVSRNIKEQSLGIGGSCEPSDPSKNPYEDSRKPLHERLAAEILAIPISPTPTPVVSLTGLSCPVEAGKVSFPSYWKNATTGHCGENYVKRAKELGYSESEYACSIYSRRAKSVDVLTDGGPNGKDVKLPTIDGRSLDWKRIEGEPLRLSRTDCFPEEMFERFGCGVGIAFQATDGSGNTWILHLLHMYEPGLKIPPNESRPSGTVVGKSEAIHVHVTIGKNVAGDQSFAVAGSNDTRDGWPTPDLEMGMCQ